jgi:glucoamylase
MLSPFRVSSIILDRMERRHLVLLLGLLSPHLQRKTLTVRLIRYQHHQRLSTNVVLDYFTWIRDSALVTKMVIDEFLQGRKEYRTVIQDYLQSQAILQTVTNPSGALLSSGRGLGEPKFNVNLTRFDGPWGRPQRDGPALRATALITYARWLLSTGDDSDANEVKEKVWPVVQNDLNFVAQYWNSTGFDLWEENSGSSFFTTAVQHRALVEGTALGKTLGNDTTNYESQAPNVLCFLQTYWNGQYAIGNINTATVRTGIDANTVLTSIASKYLTIREHMRAD